MTFTAGQKVRASQMPGYVCTSSTRPTGHSGQTIYETDTGLTMLYTGSKWVPLNGGMILGRNQRTTNLTIGATLTRILSTIATVKASRTYRVKAKMEAAAASAGATSQLELRYTTNNTEPTTTSTLLDRAVWDHRQAAIPDTVIAEGLYHAGADATFRVAVCGQRAAGAGNIDFGGAATYPGVVFVEDLGPTVNVSGTVY